MPNRRNRRIRRMSPPKIPCKYCDKSAVKLLECSICNRNLYCSVECQLDNQINHKTDCDGRTNEPKMEKRTERTHNKQTLPDFPASEKGECYSCGKSGVKLQKCSRCQEVKYCSEKCQKADLPSHKIACEKNGKIPAENSGEECDFCCKSGIKLQRCSRCQEVKYCSAKCQKADWSDHKVDCEKNEKCHFCFKSDIKLQTCLRCQKVKYCSEKCRKTDWPSHNVKCKKNEKPCHFCFKSCIKLQTCLRCQKVKYCSEKCRLADWPSHNVKCKKNENKCNSCGKFGVKLQICSRCHKVYYCSKTCQKADWPNHNVNCKIKDTEFICPRCLRIDESAYCDLCVRIYILSKYDAAKNNPEVAETMHLGFDVTKIQQIRSSSLPFIPSYFWLP